MVCHDYDNKGERCGGFNNLDYELNDMSIADPKLKQKQKKLLKI